MFTVAERLWRHNVREGLRWRWRVEAARTDPRDDMEGIRDHVIDYYTTTAPARFRAGTDREAEILKVALGLLGIKKWDNRHASVLDSILVGSIRTCERLFKAKNKSGVRMRESEICPVCSG